MKSSESLQIALVRGGQKACRVDHNEWWLESHVKFQDSEPSLAEGTRSKVPHLTAALEIGVLL